MTRNANDTDADGTASTTSTTKAATGSAAGADTADTSDGIEAEEVAAERDDGVTAERARSQGQATDSDARGRSEGNTGTGETTGDGEVDSGVEPLSLDHVFGILKNKRRRRVLRFLREAEGTVSLSETAEQIAAQENDKDVSQITSAERKRVYVGLYQCHLPKMDSMGIVSFNKPRGTIDLGEHADEVFVYLDTDDEERDRSWHAYSATLAILGLCVLVGSIAIRPLTRLPVAEGAVTLILLSFLTYALVGLRSAQAVDADEADR